MRLINSGNLHIKKHYAVLVYAYQKLVSTCMAVADVAKPAVSTHARLVVAPRARWPVCATFETTRLGRKAVAIALRAGPIAGALHAVAASVAIRERYSSRGVAGGGWVLRTTAETLRLAAVHHDLASGALPVTLLPANLVYEPTRLRCLHTDRGNPLARCNRWVQICAAGVSHPLHRHT